MWQAWVNGSLGLWLIMAAFLPMTGTENIINGVIVGAIAIVSGWLLRVIRPCQGWCSATLGLWLIGALFVPGLREVTVQQWNTVVVGVSLAILGFSAIGGTLEDKRGYRI